MVENTITRLTGDGPLAQYDLETSKEFDDVCVNASRIPFRLLEEFRLLQQQNFKNVPRSPIHSLFNPQLTKAGLVHDLYK